MKRPIYFPILLVCLFSIKALAQTPLANLSGVEFFSGGGLYIGGGSFTQSGFMTLDHDDHLLIAGIYINYNGQNKRPIIYRGDTLYTDNAKGDIVLFRIAPSGQLQWTKRISSTASMVLTGTLTDQENNTTLVFENTATCFFDGIEFEAGQYLLQLDQDGLYKWHINISGMHIESLTRDCADHIIVAGNTTSHSTGIPADTVIFGQDTFIVYQYAPDSIKAGNQIFPPAGEFNLALLKFDESGDLLWQKQYAGHFQHVCISAIYSDEIAVAAMLQSDSVNIDNIILTPSTAVNQRPLFCMKTDASGTAIWAQTYFTGSISWDAKMAPDGGLYVGMEYYLSTSYANVQIQSNGVQDILLTKLSPTGVYEWAKTVGGTSTNSRSVLSVNKQGDVAVSGFTFNVGDQVQKFDKSGNVLWTIPHSTGFGNQGAGQCVFDSQGNMWHMGWFNGDFILGSFTHSIWGGPTHIHLSKYTDQDSAGNLPDCSVISGVDMLAQSGQVRAFPNPATDRIQFETESTITGIRIFNARGQLQLQSNGGSESMMLEGLQTGVYVAVLQLEQGDISTVKFQVLR